MSGPVRARNKVGLVLAVAPLRMKFVKSATDVDQLPHSEAEVAIVGRSNVGKSSLINALSNHKKLAMVSGTPGRTRLLNLFEVLEGGTCMDLPGYGYAATSKAMRASWQRMIEDYLLHRENLEMVICLIDGAIGPTKLDVQMLDWLRASDLPHSVIATKRDKVKSSKWSRRKVDLAKGCQLEPNDIIWVSSNKGTGIEKVRSLITIWLNNK